MEQPPNPSQSESVTSAEPSEHRSRVRIVLPSPTLRRLLSLRLMLTMAVLWLLLSGMFKAQLLILGVISVGLVGYLAVKMGVLMHRGQPIYFRFFHILGYWAWLAKEILLSNIDVTKRILKADMAIKPTLRRVVATPDTDMGRAIYANSITLTPGTTAINFTANGEIIVHALHEDTLHELEGGEMAEHIRSVEIHFEPSIDDPAARN